MLLFNINQFQGLVHIYQPISAFLARSPRSKTWFKSQNPRYPTSSYKFGGEHQIVPKRTKNEWGSERGPCTRLANDRTITLYRHTHVARAGWSSSTKSERRRFNFCSHTCMRLAHIRTSTQDTACVRLIIVRNFILAESSGHTEVLDRERNLLKETTCSCFSSCVVSFQQFLSRLDLLA